MLNFTSGTDLIVFSSDKFGSEDLRTTLLMKEFAARKRVYFIEAPILNVAREATYFMQKEDHEVCLIQPYLPAETSVFEQKKAMLDLLKEFLNEEHISHYTMWTDTPKAMHFIRHLNPEIIIYDCVKDYSVSHPEIEKELFQYADVVLTSGMGSQVTSPEKNVSTKAMCLRSSNAICANI